MIVMTGYPELIKLSLSTECSHSPSVSGFRKKYRKKLFKGGKVSLPNYCLGVCGKLFHISRVGKVEHKREVVFMKRAIEIVKDLHQKTNEGICAPGGINTLVRSFTATFYFKGIRKIVREILDHCTGTCKYSSTCSSS